MPEESLEPQIKLQKIGDAKQQTENESGIETKPRGPGETPATPLSKNQLKKQKRLEKYEELKKVRRLKERERQKLKRLEAHAQGLPARVGPSRKELKKRQLQCTEQQSGKLCVAIDLDYDDLMHDRDVSKCIKQCLRIYTINRRSKCPGHLHITGIKTDGRIHSSLKRNDGWENWHLKYHFNQTHNDVFPKEKIVYLTCESDTVLDRIEGDFVYVIGGLVDHNHHKGLCHKRATEIGLRTARLPLSEHVNMKTRAVLSTFHVFEILMRVTEGKSWTDAIMETLPVRKGAKPKVNTDSSAENQLKGNEEINSNEQILLKDQE
ncbi:PREDICTED: tRNA methyltransferase 10 homolog A-like isoform X1 [Rhagoletis zephyria]|uniref:tRNA methyltransferase 10 homolog A-like isoform X1 n=1 Tax=Rhagoletis zephyria TaxID=28612 RepID=UPI00081190ED|nr:PREDICTED: tRNA methyltransferase 10 homolog A-like isoform X1 [Rhagoletis zephyria]XP_017477934.1 PREDICTED: tRNA methyltransferase 10 homolog A-like isoform X1 [Rhagoletis zephyria]